MFFFKHYFFDFARRGLWLVWSLGLQDKRGHKIENYKRGHKFFG